MKKPRNPTLKPVDMQTPGELTPDEIALVRAYRGCSDNTQELMVDFAQRCADTPSLKRHPSKPALRLIATQKAGRKSIRVRITGAQS